MKKVYTGLNCVCQFSVYDLLVILTYSYQ